jgi:hypothetical protein
MKPTVSVSASQTQTQTQTPTPRGGNGTFALAASTSNSVLAQIGKLGISASGAHERVRRLVACIGKLLVLAGFHASAHFDAHGFCLPSSRLADDVMSLPSSTGICWWTLPASRVPTMSIEVPKCGRVDTSNIHNRLVNIQFCQAPCHPKYPVCQCFDQPTTCLLSQGRPHTISWS